MALEFGPGSLPRLRSGWTRDYFFMANGYEKDMDFYAATGDRVEPLPFRSMSRYPYPSGQYPLNDEQIGYFLNYNTRYVSGEEPVGYSYSFSQH